jgi:hypothetical protein
MKPLSPSEVEKKAQSDIPDCVIDAVNNLLVKEYRNGSATLRQKDILKEIRRIDENMTSTILFENGWMDFEPIFRKAGWSVEYDKPGYNEDYEATFKFKKKN